MLFQGKKLTCIINYKDSKYTFDLERHKTVNDLYNTFTEKITDKNYPFRIMHSSNKNLVEIKNLDTTLLSLEKDNQIHFTFLKSFKCPSCSEICDNESKYINKYCLDCNQYICSICSKKKDSKHNSHYLVNINQNNLKDSVKLWNINLNADLSNQITQFNQQLSFINDKDSDMKRNLWLESIFKKIKYFENLLNDIKSKYEDLKHIIKETEDILSNAMANLTKSEQDFNTEIYNKEKIFVKFFSFEEAEKQIQKLKNNYKEIKEAKSKVCTIINLDNIKTYQEILYNIPKSFDDLTKCAFLILEDLKNFEKNNKKSIKKESRSRSRKKTDQFLNNREIFNTASDAGTFVNKKKNRNIFVLLDNTRKKTDLSIKIKDIVNFSESNEENNKFGDSNNKLISVKYTKNSNMIDNGKKSSEIKLSKNNPGTGVDSSRYTPKSLKLPKIYINTDKERKDNILLSKYNDDIKRSMELHKTTKLLKKAYK